jgi:MFS family permease
MLILDSLATIAPLYISEIAPPEIRGALLVLQEFSIVFGIVIAFWTTYGTRFMTCEWSWRLPFLLQMVPGVILGVGIVFLPFSPRWLASKGRDDGMRMYELRMRQTLTSYTMI